MLDAVVVEGSLDALGGRGSDALVDRECLPQVRGAVAGVAVPEAALADSFQGACFLQGIAAVAGDAERLGVVVASPVAGSGSGQ